jgi:hypothetical protein
VWYDERTRALFLPIVGVLGVLVVVVLAATTDVDGDVIVAAITAIVTLTASAAGHAAGAAWGKSTTSRSEDGPG